MLYKNIGICLVLYASCLQAAASSNSSALTSSGGSGAHRETQGKVSFSGSVAIGSPVRPVPSPTISIVMGLSPDSPPQDIKLNLAAVGRIQSNSSLASQLSERYKRQLNALVPLTTPTDSERLKAEFQQDVNTYLPSVAATDVATVLAIIPSVSGSLHTSSSDEETDGSSGKSSPNYVKSLESIVEAQNRQLEFHTRVYTYHQLHSEEERQRWAADRQSLESDRDNQRWHTRVGYAAAIVTTVVGTVLGVVPLILSQTGGC